jgi:hypothetical protein
MRQGVADEVVVAVKPIAGEGMVTYRRIKLSASDRDVGGEERNKESVTLTITTHRRERSGLKTAASPWSGGP